MSCGDCDQNHPLNPNDAPIPLEEQWKHLHWLQAFWTRSYRENITGLSGMVAYNLMLAIFPFAFLVLFIFSQVLRINGVEDGIFNDLQRLFPDAEQKTLDNILNSIRANSVTIGAAAAVGSIWIGASFWGAMDTAFCRIYHVECRGWWEQKRFSLGMLLVVTLFLLGSVVLPAGEGALIRSTESLPFGLNGIQSLDSIVLVSVTLVLNFVVSAVIYWAVPKGHMPWRAVWPGAMFATIVAGLANWLFPVYLTNVSALDNFGTTIGFILIALLWFYLVALTILAGAVINSLRHEYYDIGQLPYGIVSRASLLMEALAREEEAARRPLAEPYRSLTASASPADDPSETLDQTDVIHIDTRRKQR
ncbi:MAG: YihY/virulence factor BrkB family protein [Actinomycetota bacterium]|nr:YihY/virulence factor BrkB family protein [Actinomycetota bacterium]